MRRPVSVAGLFLIIPPLGLAMTVAALSGSQAAQAGSEQANQAATNDAAPLSSESALGKAQISPVIHSPSQKITEPVPIYMPAPLSTPEAKSHSIRGNVLFTSLI